MKYSIKNSISNIVSSVPGRMGIVLTLAVSVVALGGSAFAYGPERPTYTIEAPADHITFNSITNNPNYGDERNFMLVKDASNTSAGGWQDSINVQDGKEYLVRLYVHNNAASNLNLVAKNTRVMANVPNTTGTSIQLDGFVTADNASPAKIWDSVVMTSDKKFNIGYVAGSAMYYNNVKPGGQALPDSIVTNAGALVGYNAMDGNVPGCFEYSGIATFKVKVQTESPNFTVEKKVRVHGTTAWAKNVTAQPGQQVDYQIGYANVGTNPQDDVVVKDQLPAGVTYLAGSTTLKNAANSNGDGLKLTSNEVVTATGVNIGNYDVNSNAFVRFTATLPTADKLACGPNTLTNTATVSTDNGNKSDTAAVNINVTCAANECMPGVPKGDARCATALPETGPAEVILTLIGIAAVTFGVVYYLRSRRDLQTALHAAQSHTVTTSKQIDAKPVAHKSHEATTHEHKK